MRAALPDVVDVRDADVLVAASPALEPFAGAIVHVGGPGTGQIVKLCNTLIYAAQTLATAEATTMAAKAGVDLRKLLSAASATGYGREDFSSMGKIVRRLADV